MDVPCKVVGVTFNNRQQAIAKINIGDYLKLIPERHNRYDCNAIGVWTFKTNEHIGYLQRGFLAENGVSPFYFSSGLATVVDLIGGDAASGKPNLGVRIQIYDIKQWRSTNESLTQDALTDANNRIAELEEQVAALTSALHAIRVETEQFV